MLGLLALTVILGAAGVARLVSEPVLTFGMGAFATATGAALTVIPFATPKALFLIGIRRSVRIPRVADIASLFIGLARWRFVPL